MTFEEALNALKEGKKIRRKDWCDGFFITLTSNKCLVVNGRTSGLFLDDFSEDCWEEYEEPVLDDAEKKYLSAVIKPFRDRVCYICKLELISCNQFIHMEVKRYDEDTSYDYINLPIFKKDTMYKNMKVGKDYTLKELGL